MFDLSSVAAFQALLFPFYLWDIFSGCGASKDSYKTMICLVQFEYAKATFTYWYQKIASFFLQN